MFLSKGWMDNFLLVKSSVSDRRKRRKFVKNGNLNAGRTRSITPLEKQRDNRKASHIGKGH
jgi:hypothetical protein